MRRRTIALLLLVLAGCARDGGELRPAPPTSSTTEAPAPVVQTIAPIDADALLTADQATAIDVRSGAEFEAGHVPGATLVDFDAGGFETAVAGFARDATYVVYSNSGKRGGDAVQTMLGLGFGDVRELEGGLDAWIALGLPLEP